MALRNHANGVWIKNCTHSAGYSVQLPGKSLNDKATEKRHFWMALSIFTLRRMQFCTRKKTFQHMTLSGLLMVMQKVASHGCFP